MAGNAKLEKMCWCSYALSIDKDNFGVIWQSSKWNQEKIAKNIEWNWEKAYTTDSFSLICIKR